MASKQVRDILEHVREFHRQLKRAYDRLSRHTDDERLHYLLQYMGRHEEAFDRCLEKYEADAVNGVLNTWIQFAPDEVLKEACRDIAVDERATVDDVVACALKVDDVLLNLYRELASSTGASKVQELFTDLLQMEENKDHQYARSVLE